MAILEDTRERLEATGEKIKRSAEDNFDRVGDKLDEFKADAEVKRAEAERDSVKDRNQYKEDLRDTS